MQALSHPTNGMECSLYCVCAKTIIAARPEGDLPVASRVETTTTQAGFAALNLSEPRKDPCDENRTDVVVT